MPPRKKIVRVKRSRAAGNSDKELDTESRQRNVRTRQTTPPNRRLSKAQSRIEAEAVARESAFASHRQRAEPLKLNWEKTFVRSAATSQLLRPYIERAEQLGWGQIISMETQGYPSLVKDFYAALCLAGDDNIVIVRGVPVPFTVASLEELFQLPRVSPCPFWDGALNVEWAQIESSIHLEGMTFTERAKGMKVINYSRTKFELRPWFHFICYTLLGTSHHSSLTEDGAQLLYHIVHGNQIDVARLFIDVAMEFKTHPRTTRSLRFPALISRLCVHHGVPTQGELPFKGSTPRMNSSSVRRMLDENHPPPQPQVAEEPVVQEQRGAVPQAPALDNNAQRAWPMGWTTERLNRMEQTIQTIHDRQLVMDEKLNAFMEEMRRSFRGPPPPDIDMS